MNPRQPPQCQHKMPVGPGIIHRPKCAARSPIAVAAAEPAESPSAENDIRIHQTREHELGLLLVIGRNRKRVVFKSRVLMPRLLKILKTRQHADADYARRRYPRRSHASSM